MSDYNDGMSVKDIFWFTELMESRPIGIALCIDSLTGERKAYIGTGEGHSGAMDMLAIIGGGAKIHLDAAEAIVSFLKKGEQQ